MGIYRGNNMICNMEKHECLSCMKEFIVGTELLDDKEPSCPYCKASETDRTVWTEDEDLEQTNMDLGCLSIAKEIIS